MIKKYAKLLLRNFPWIEGRVREYLRKRKSANGVVKPLTKQAEEILNELKRSD